jgi:hypothetical protein
MLTEIFGVIAHFLQQNAGLVPPFGHVRFLLSYYHPHPPSHNSSYHRPSLSFVSFVERKEKQLDATQEDFIASVCSMLLNIINFFTHVDSYLKEIIKNME